MKQLLSSPRATNSLVEAGLSSWPALWSAAAMTGLFNYETVRWLEKHHNRRVVNQCALDESKVKQLQEMFEHLDDDGSGSIELDEIQLAIQYIMRSGVTPETLNEKGILEKFEYIDSDGSGSIDFAEVRLSPHPPPQKNNENKKANTHTCIRSRIVDAHARQTRPSRCETRAIAPRRRRSPSDRPTTITKSSREELPPRCRPTHSPPPPPPRARRSTVILSVGAASRTPTPPPRVGRARAAESPRVSPPPSSRRDDAPNAQFVAVMTSDMRGQEFFRLSDERDAASQHKAFFEFATIYRREMILENIGDENLSTLRRCVRRRVARRRAVGGRGRNDARARDVKKARRTAAAAWPCVRRRRQERGGARATIATARWFDRWFDREGSARHDVRRRVSRGACEV